MSVTLVEMFEQHPEIMTKAMEDSLIVKIATDSSQAGGVLIEINCEENLNRAMSQLGLPYVVMTNKGIERVCSRFGEKVFDFSKVNAEGIKQLKSATKTSGTDASAADLFLFLKSNGRLILQDCNSFKTSTSVKVNQIYLHNDSDGSIFTSIVDGRGVSIGKVILLTFDEETEECEIYFAEGNISKFTELFSPRSKEQLCDSEIVFHGTELLNKSDITQYSGKNRILVKTINREKKKKKKDESEDLKPTSFTRGIMIDKRFLNVLSSRGVIKKIHSFYVPSNKIEQEDFPKRYPQFIDWA